MYFNLSTWAMTDDGIHFVEIRPLKLSEFTSLSQDLSAIQDCETNLFFRAVTNNYHTMEGTFATLEAEGRASPENRMYTPGPRALQMRVLAELSNFFSTTRTYKDATSHSLSRIFGRDSDLRWDFVQSLSRQYDTEPDYRLCEGLRNAMQHSGDLPLSLSVRKDEKGATNYRVIANREELLASYDWNKIPREDLLAGPSEVDVTSAIRNYWSCFLTVERERVHRQLKHELPRLEGLARLYAEENLDQSTPTVLLRFDQAEQPISSFYPRFGPTLVGIEELVKLGRADTARGIMEADESATVGDSRNMVAPVEAQEIMRAWLIEGPQGAAEVIGAALESPVTAHRAITGLVNIAGVAISQVNLVLGHDGGTFLDSFYDPDES